MEQLAERLRPAWQRRADMRLKSWIFSGECGRGDQYQSGGEFQWKCADIAENSLILSSIVLAVYVAVITGIIHSDLANKM